MDKAEVERQIEKIITKVFRDCPQRDIEFWNKWDTVIMITDILTEFVMQVQSELKEDIISEIIEAIESIERNK